VFAIPQLHLGEAPRTRFKNIEESLHVELLNKPHTMEQVIAICFPIIAESWNPNHYMPLDDEGKMQLIQTQFKEKRFLTLLENFRVSIQVDGVPRSITHQIVRHRKCNFSQESFRVCDIRMHDVAMSEQVANSNPALKDLYIKTVNKCKDAYAILVDSGVSPEFARDVMPMGTLTSIIINGNLGDIVQYLNMRTGGEVMDTHRFVVSRIKELLQFKEPVLWEMVKYLVLPDAKGE